MVSDLLCEALEYVQFWPLSVHQQARVEDDNVVVA